MLGSERLGLVGTKLLGFCSGACLEVLSPLAVVLEEMLGFPELCYVWSCASTLLAELRASQGFPNGMPAALPASLGPSLLKTHRLGNFGCFGGTRSGGREGTTVWQKWRGHEDVPSAASSGERSPPRAASRGRN